ncbi:transporter LysE family [Vibrio variabilis]|uniref:Transporter LysE family n=1 Tax=Vibrio variabilis TaxID=990271 RepID=A0ABQ0JB18_9VIBR|nr:transporter LysE family [Vibrio variabilis]
MCAVCAISDAALITAGVSGFGVVIEKYPQVEQIARYAGAAFLFVYSFQSFRSAISSSHQLDPEGDANSSLTKTVLICLALTWLNHMFTSILSFFWGLYQLNMRLSNFLLVWAL